MTTVKTRMREGRYIHNLLMEVKSLDQIARELGMTRETVKNRHWYWRNHKRYLRERGELVPDGPVAFYTYERFGVRETGPRR